MLTNLCGPLTVHVVRAVRRLGNKRCIKQKTSHFSRNGNTMFANGRRHVCEVRVTFRPLPPSSVHELVLQPPVLYEEHFRGEVFGFIKRALSDVIL